MKTVLDFLSDLKKNNNRDWFLQNKKRYDASRQIFLSEVSSILHRIQHKDPNLLDLDPKNTMFRINRDIRFSKDKTPYKTNFASYMAKGGKNSTNAGYYIHISDDEFFMGAGVYNPPKEELKAIRQEILYQPDKFKSLINSRLKLGFSMHEDDKLKNGPMDFPKDSPHIELLKYKHYLLSRDLKKEEVLSENFSGIVAGYFETLVPFTEFLNTAMEYKGNE